MGAGISCLPRYGCCVPRHAPNACKENHTSTPKRRSKHKYHGANGNDGMTGNGKMHHRRNLSAAFNMADMDGTMTTTMLDNGFVGNGGGAGSSNGGGTGNAGFLELLNVNTATEEELMTLPGINRHTAHNIVEYRKQIGAFKKVTKRKD